MKIIKLFVLMLLVTTSIEAKYCIQVFTMHKSKLNFLIRKAKSSRYNKFDSVRVENFGKYLVLRIGNYPKYGNALNDVAKIRTTTRDAYIKKCNLIRDNILFIKNEKNDTIVKKPIYKKPVRKKKIPKKVKREKKVPKKTYTKKEELTYTYKNSDNSLWGDCKKCFIPVYEEDEGPVYEEEIIPVQKQVKRKKEVRVEIEDPLPTKESFWARDNYSKPKRKNHIKNKQRNKFNIDEQFLP